MKRVIFAGIMSIAATGLFAQEGNKTQKKESQEIVIKKTGDSKEKITIVVDGDVVTVNGKPMADFKDDNVKVIKRKSIVRNGNAFSFFGDMEPAMAWGQKPGDGKPSAFLGVMTDGENEAKISEVTKESAAEKAGLQKGDIITKIDDKKIENFDDIADVIKSHKPKDEVTVYFKRDGKEKSAKAILGERKSTEQAYSFSGPGMRAFSLPRAPFATHPPEVNLWYGDGHGEGHGEGHGDFDMTDQMKKRFDDTRYNFDFALGKPKLGLKIQDTEDEKGVKVMSVEEGSAAEKAGLKKEDVITEIGGKKVTNTDEARDQMHENAGKASYNIKANRNGSEMSFEVKIPKKLKTANL